MSPEHVLSVKAPVSPSPSPSPGCAAAPAAGSSGSSCAGGAGSGATGAPAAGTAAHAGAHGADAHRAQSPAGHSESAPQGTKPDKRPAVGDRSGKAQPAKPAAARVRTGSEFSQALAQSLAAPAHATAQQPAPAHTGKPHKPPVKHGTDKEHPTHPVSAPIALAVMSQPAPAARSVAHGEAAKQSNEAAKRPGATPAPRGGAADNTTQKDPSPALRDALLAQAAGQDQRTPQGPSKQAVNPASAGAAAPATGAALSAGQLLGATHVAAPTRAVSAALSEPVGSSGWRAQLGAQLTWMARQGVQSASLQVSPQHLGPVHVSISVHHGQASVWFGAAEVQTRQALTQALPELRAMFANQGLALTDSGVSHDSPRDPRRPAQQTVGAVSEVGEVGGSQGGAGGGALAGVGLLDTYA